MWTTRPTEKGSILVLEGGDAPVYWTDARDPAGEARRSVEASVPRDCRVALVWLGAGHVAQAVLERCRGLRRLYVLENDAQRLAASRRCTETARVLADPRVCLLFVPRGGPLPPEAREQLARDTLFFFEGKVALHIGGSERSLEPETSMQAGEWLLEHTRRVLSGVALRATRGWHILANTLLNLARAGGRGADALVGAAAGRPVVVVGAGPSLDKTVQKLAACAGRVTVVACDGAWPTLSHAGIVPDLVVSTDDTEKVWRHIAQAGVPRQPVPIAAMLHSSWPVARHYRGPMLFFGSAGGAGRVLERGLPQPLPALDAGQCVGHAAFEVARQLGGNPLILLGFDLAYDGDRFHPKDAAVPYFHEHLPPPENLVCVPGIDGRPVRTDVSMVLYLREFERRIAECGVRVWDATEGGALIQGARVGALEAALAECPATDKPPLRAAGRPAGRHTPVRRRPSLKAARRRWTEGAGTLLGRIETALAQGAAVEEGTLPYPFLADHAELLDMLSEAVNPVPYAAFRLAWEDRRGAGSEPAGAAEIATLGRAYLGELARVLRLIPELLALPIRTDEAVPSRAMSFSSRPADAGRLDRARAALRAAGLDVLDCDADPDDLPGILGALRTRQVGAVLMLDGALFPSAWAIPGCVCLDLRTSAPAGDVLYEQWLPGYAAVCEDPEIAAAWRGRVPSDRPVCLAQPEGLLWLDSERPQRPTLSWSSLLRGLRDESAAGRNA